MTRNVERADLIPSSSNADLWEVRALNGARRWLRNSGEYSAEIFSQTWTSAKAQTEYANLNLSNGLAASVGESIAIVSDHTLHTILDLQGVASDIMNDAALNFTNLPYADAKETLAALNVGRIDQIMQVLGIDDVNMTAVLDNVDIRDMIQIINQYFPTTEVTTLSPLEIQQVLQTSSQIRADDSFRPLIDAMHELPIDHPQLTENKMVFLETLIQLQDATYAFVSFNRPGSQRRFDPQRLDVYPFSIQTFMENSGAQNPKEAVIFAAFNILKNCRATNGDSLSPLLKQK